MGRGSNTHISYRFYRDNKMNKQQIGICLALRELGIPLEMDSFDKRLALQKTILILQKAGVYLGYRYGWYLRGPYSPDLASDLFMITSLHDKGSSEIQNWILDSDSKSILTSIKNLFNNNNPIKEHSRHLELVASILFLLDTGQAKKTDQKGIVDILKKNRKYFSLEDVKSAFEELTNYGFTF